MKETKKKCQNKRKNQSKIIGVFYCPNQNGNTISIKTVINMQTRAIGLLYKDKVTRPIDYRKRNKTQVLKLLFT